MGLCFGTYQHNFSVYNTIWAPGTVHTHTDMHTRRSGVTHYGCAVTCLSTIRQNGLDTFCVLNQKDGWSRGLKRARGDTVTNSSRSTRIRKTIPVV